MSVDITAPLVLGTERFDASHTGPFDPTPTAAELAACDRVVATFRPGILAALDRVRVPASELVAMVGIKSHKLDLRVEDGRRVCVVPPDAWELFIMPRALYLQVQRDTLRLVREPTALALLRRNIEAGEAAVPAFHLRLIVAVPRTICVRDLAIPAGSA